LPDLSKSKSNGIKILYTGHVVNSAREGVFLASYFYTYEGVREVLINRVEIIPQIAIPISGGISGALAWFVSFPLDCIKAGIQGQKIEDGKLPKTKGIEVSMKLWRNKGLKGLYSGVTPTLLRAFLVSGSRFSAYEFALWLLNHYD